MDVLNAVMESLTRRQTARVADYQQAVVAIADGKRTDPDTLAGVLEAAGKGPEDLREAVAGLTERRRLRATMDSGPAAKKRLAEVESLLAAIEKKREAANVKCDGERWPLDAELEGLAATITAASNAQRELWRTCPDAEILARDEAITAELEELANERSRVADDRERAGQLMLETKKKADFREGSEEASLRANQETYRLRVVAAVARQAELEAAHAKLLAERESLAARRLEV